MQGSPLHPGARSTAGAQLPLIGSLAGVCGCGAQEEQAEIRGCRIGCMSGAPSRATASSSSEEYSVEYSRPHDRWNMEYSKRISWIFLPGRPGRTPYTSSGSPAQRDELPAKKNRRSRGAGCPTSSTGLTKPCGPLQGSGRSFQPVHRHAIMLGSKPRRAAQDTLTLPYMGADPLPQGGVYPYIG